MNNNDIIQKANALVERLKNPSAPVVESEIIDVINGLLDSNTKMHDETLPLSMQIKLASIAVHGDELGAITGYDDVAMNARKIDTDAIRGLMQDPEVAAFLANFERQCLLPLRRDGVRYDKDGAD